MSSAWTPAAGDDEGMAEYMNRRSVDELFNASDIARVREAARLTHRACSGLSPATLTALAEAGGVKRVLELLALAAEVQGCTEMTHEDAYHALFKQPTLDNVWLPIRALLEKLGGVE